MSLFNKFCHNAHCSCKQSQHRPLKVVLEIYYFFLGRSQVLQNWPPTFSHNIASSYIHFKSMIPKFPFTQRHLVVKILICSIMLLIFSMPVLLRHLWQLKSVVFQHRCLICAVLLSRIFSSFCPVVLGSTNNLVSVL